MKVLITGGAGFIGSNFIFYMRKKHPDYQLICLDKLTYAGNLATLKPVMEEIAAEKGVSVEDIFILYMDLASEASVEAENQLQATLDEDEAADFSRIANRLS